MPIKGRLLGVDLGERRIGVAICDDQQVLATPLATLKRVGDQVAEHAELKQLTLENEIVGLVIGCPTALDGSDNPAVQKVRAEVKKLGKRLGVPVVLFDERFTTSVAQGMLHETNQSIKQTRSKIDSAAAAVILQGFIDSKIELR